MKSLSERLDEQKARAHAFVHWASLDPMRNESELGDWRQMAQDLDEAAALAKRYEDAPVESVGALPGSNGGFGAVCLPREFVGQRVRIVLDKEG